MSTTGRGTLIRFTVASALLEVQFWFPVWLLFLLDRGITLPQALLADGLFRLVVVACEVPMGRLADQLGRRRAMLLSAAANAAVFSAIVAVGSFASLLGVWVLWGVVWALTSGISTSYLFALSESGAIDQAPERALGLVRAAGTAAVLVSLVAAGYLYRLETTLPFVVTAALAVVAFFLLSGLPNPGPPPRDRARSSRGGSGVDPALPFLVGAAGMVLAFGWSAQILFQPLSLDLLLGADGSGWLHAGYAAAAIVGHAACARATRRPTTHAVPGAWLLMAAALALAASEPLLGAVVALPLLGFAFAYASTLLEGRVGRHSTDRHRATALSVVSLLGGLVIAVARPSLGLVSDEWGVPTAFGCWAVTGLVALPGLLLLLRQAQRVTVPGHPAR